mgnify:CR=1 FL=1
MEMKRRDFMQTAAAGTAAFTLAGATFVPKGASAATAKPALLGGPKVRTEPFPSWPIIEENDEKAWMEVLRERGWCRTQGERGAQFEKAYAEMMGAKECIATANGTSALFCSLNGLGVGPGDEVIVPPYTFVATVNVVLLQHALPIFVDTDRETSQIDAKKIEEKITENTRCIIPVHLGGNVADMDTILAVAAKHNIPVIEDACQAHLAEWKGKKVGTMGKTGCFSFQVTKNLSSGEGGAILSDDSDLMDRCYAFHTNGRARRQGSYHFTYGQQGSNLRMTEFQAAVLLGQLERLAEQTKTRQASARRLHELLEGVEGVSGVAIPGEGSASAVHLFLVNYDPAAFAGLPKAKMLEALAAENTPAAPGYTPIHRLGMFARDSTGRSVAERDTGMELDFSGTVCPFAERICGEYGFWIYQKPFLAGPEAIEDYARALLKIQRNASELL